MKILTKLILAVAIVATTATAEARGGGGGGHGGHSGFRSSKGYSAQTDSSSGKAVLGRSSVVHSGVTHSGASIRADSVKRDTLGRITRSSSERHKFMVETGYPHGRKGYVVDHIIALKRGGLDEPTNMQWQTKAEAKAKDRVE